MLERLFVTGFGFHVDMEWRMARLGYVAQAMNKGDLSLAAISLVHAQLPPLPDPGSACRMAMADGLLAKDNPYWDDEPRFLLGVRMAVSGRRVTPIPRTRLAD